MTIYNTQQQYKPIYKCKLRAIRGSSQPYQNILKVNWLTCAHNSDCLRLQSSILFLFFLNTFLNISLLKQTIIVLDLNSLEALARKRERGNQSGMVRWPSLTFKKHMAYRIWRFLLSKNKNLMSKPYIKWKFPITLSLKGVGKGIQFPWLGVLFGSILVIKS